MANWCEVLGKGLVRSCYECRDYPCNRLKALDKRHRTKYHMSMIENLEVIKEHGIEDFMRREKVALSQLRPYSLKCLYHKGKGSDRIIFRKLKVPT